MLKLLKHLKKTEYLLILLILCVITVNVWLELKIFDYMNSITKVIVAGGNNVSDILKNGGYMIGCALGSVAGAIIVNFFVTRLSARLGMRIRSAVYDKVMSFSTGEIKHFSTSSLITRTTNDITQIQNLFSMGVRILFRAPIMVVMALLKISASDISWTIATISAVAFLVISIVTISFLFGIIYRLNLGLLLLYYFTIKIHWLQLFLNDI